MASIGGPRCRRRPRPVAHSIAPARPTRPASCAPSWSGGPGDRPGPRPQRGPHRGAAPGRRGEHHAHRRGRAVLDHEAEAARWTRDRHPHQARGLARTRPRLRIDRLGLDADDVCAFFAGLFPDQAQRDVWEGSPGNRIAGVLAPSAEATRIDGGYRATGSGLGVGLPARAVGVVGSRFRPDRGEIVDQGLALVPMTDLTISTPGTSPACAARVRHAGAARHRHPRAPVLSIRRPSAPVRHGAHRRGPLPVGVRAGRGDRPGRPQLGLAQAALDLVIEKAPKRARCPTPSTTPDRGTDRAAPRWPRQASLVDAAALFAYRAAADIDQAAADGVYPDYAARARCAWTPGGDDRERPGGHRVLDLGHGAGSFAEEAARCSASGATPRFASATR